MKADQEWHKFIPWMRYNMNSRPLLRLGNTSPAELMFGRRFLHPKDFEEQAGELATINLQEFAVQRDLSRRKAMAN